MSQKLEAKPSDFKPDHLGLLYVSGNLPTYPFPRPTFCPKWEVRANVDGSPYFSVFNYARAVKQKVRNEAENKERDWEETLKIFFSLTSVWGSLARFARVRLLRHALPISVLILEKKTVLQSSASVGLGEGRWADSPWSPCLLLQHY